VILRRIPYLNPPMNVAPKKVLWTRKTSQASRKDSEKESRKERGKVSRKDSGKGYDCWKPWLTCSSVLSRLVLKYSGR